MAYRKIGIQYAGNGVTIYEKPERTVERIKWLDTVYVPERTCRLTVKTNERPGKTVFNQWYACSECDCILNPGDRYFHGCGAKVVE